MNEYVAALRKYATENPPNYGSDAHSILDMLYCYYHECNNTDTEALKTAFEDLYLRMYGIPFGKWIGSWMPSAHSAGSMRRPGLWRGVKVGIQLEQKLTKVRARQK